MLTWRTGSEQNSHLFEIEQSTNGSSFNKIGQVAAAGNSNTLIDYTFTDLSINRYGSNRIYYRLRQIDLDGRATYSNIRMLNLDGNESTWKAYPVPFSDLLVLDMPAGLSGNAQINLTDMNGRIIYSRQVKINTGQTNIVLSSLPNMPKGSYILSFITASQQKTITVMRK